MARVMLVVVLASLLLCGLMVMPQQASADTLATVYASSDYASSFGPLPPAMMTWTQLRTASPTPDKALTSTNPYYAGLFQLGNGYKAINRGVVYFNIPNYIQYSYLSSASISLYITSNGLVSTDQIYIVAPANPSSMLPKPAYWSDTFSSNFGTVIASLTSSSITLNAYNDIPLNANGRTWLYDHDNQEVGLLVITKADYDGTNVPTANGQDRRFCYNGISGNDPKLNVVAGPANTNPPVASFTWRYGEINGSHKIFFTDTSTNYITNWTWVFDGIKHSYVQNPNWVFTPGVHTAVLTVTGPYGTSTYYDSVLWPNP